MTSLVTITPAAENIIAYCARVSNPANQNNTNISRLIKYCIKHKHWSVFEQAWATLEITTSRAISRQLLRHRSFVFQEFSQRYSQVADSPILFEARSQDTTNRQNSIDNMHDFQKTWFKIQQQSVWKTAYASYTAALSRGIAKEQARALLPEGLTPTKLYMSGTIRSWIHFCQLRGGNGSQKEIQRIAKTAFKILQGQCPNIFTDDFYT